MVEAYVDGPLAGLSVTNGYDLLLRRTNLTLLSGSAVLSSTAYGYEANSGRLAGVSDGTHSATYGYLDNSSLVEQIQFQHGTATRMTTIKSYDLLNRLTNIVSSAGGSNVVSFAYAYNTANQRTSVTNVDGSYWVYTYDDLGQVISGKKRWSDGTPVAGQQFDYGFDDIGNRETATRDGRQSDYSANLLNQYESLTVPGYVNILGSATNTATVTVWTEDGLFTTARHDEYFRAEVVATNSNPLWLAITNIAVLQQGTNADLVATNVGRLLIPQTPEAFTHDADGNLTSDSLWTNTWNAENRRTLIESRANVPVGGRAREQWTHLPDGRWIERIVSTNDGSAYYPAFTNRYVWDGNILLAVLDAAGNVLQAYTRGLDLSGTHQGAGGVGGLLWMSAGTNGTHFACFDGNGNVIALVDTSTGEESARYEYGPFSEDIRATGPMARINSLRFSTQYADDVTGDRKYLHRDLDAATGRWPNGDPIGELGGKNLYAFVGNDPIRRVDPLGLQSPQISLAEAIASGNVAQVEAILAGMVEGDAGYALAQAFLRKVAQCTAIWSAYKALNCKGCDGCKTKGEAAANAACLTAEVAGRAAYLKLKCDYVLAGSIARGSAKAEKGHQIELANKTKALAKCTAKAATLPDATPPAVPPGTIPSTPGGPAH